MSKFRRPRWKDPRLGVGVLLVAISVALGAWIFAEADKTEAVYIARAPIAVGETLQDAQWELVDVNLGAVRSSYLNVEGVAELSVPSEDVRFIHSVPAGELVPRSALGSVDDLQMRPVSISTSTPAPLEVGSVVDLWVMTEDVTGREQAEPELVATGLHVRAVEDDQSLFTSANGMLIHALVAEEDLARVLAALGPRAHITLVPQLSGQK